MHFYYYKKDLKLALPHKSVQRTGQSEQALATGQLTGNRIYGGAVAWEILIGQKHLGNDNVVELSFEQLASRMAMPVLIQPWQPGASLLDQLAPLAQRKDGRPLRLAVINGLGTMLGDNLIGATALARACEALAVRFGPCEVDVVLGWNARPGTEEIHRQYNSIRTVYGHGITLDDFLQYDAFWDFSALLKMQGYNDLPLVDFYLHQLGLDPASIGADSKRPRLRLAEDATRPARERVAASAQGRPAVFVQAQASTPLRGMPQQFQFDLIDTILAQSNAVVVLADEALLAHAARWDAAPGRVCNQWDWASGSTERYAALIAACDAIVSVDSFAIHVAAARAMPGLALFSTIDPALRVCYAPTLDGVLIPQARELPCWGHHKVDALWEAARARYEQAWSALPLAELWRALALRMDAAAARPPAGLKLHLGCGDHYIDGWCNVDYVPDCRPDVVCNLEQFPWPWADNSVDAIMLNHVLEHLGEEREVFLGIVKELYRVCRHNASIFIRVPHPRHDNFLWDPTHVRVITEQGLRMFDQQYNRSHSVCPPHEALLGLQLGVDFRLSELSHDYVEPYHSMIADGKISKEEVERRMHSENNVCKQINLRWVVKKMKDETMRETPPATLPLPAGLAGLTGLKLNLGSGAQPMPGWCNVDKLAECQPDVQFDLETFPWPWGDNSVDEINMSHVLQQLGQSRDVYLGVIKELYRVARPGATIHLRVPHPRHDTFLWNPLNVRPVPLEGLQMFDQKLNRKWQEMKASNTPLGLYLGVDFHIASVQFVLDPLYADLLKRGETTNEQLNEWMKVRNNVCEQTVVDWLVVKPEVKDETTPTSDADAAMLAAAIEHHKAGRLAEAEALYARLPHHANALQFRGAIVHQQGNNELAIELIQQSLALDAANPLSQYHLGMVYATLSRYDEAIVYYRRAIALSPGFQAAYTNLGVALFEQGNYEEAIASYRTAIDLGPPSAALHVNLGNALKSINGIDEAAAQYTVANELDPDRRAGRLALAGVHLLRGDMEPGWECYEARWDTDGLKAGKHRFAQPAWRGDASLRGKRLFLHAEQGIGDTLQMLRFVPLLAEMGAIILVEAQPALHALLTRLPHIAALSKMGDPVPEFDVHCPFLSLPRALKVRADYIPGEARCIRADLAQVQAMRAALGPRTAVRVGICWKGSPHYPLDHQRSMGLEPFKPLFALPGVQFFNLMPEGRDEFLAAAGGAGVDLGHVLDAGTAPFEETAALIEELDLVITCDTSLGHLAATLGKPVWLALPLVPDWRWMLEREDSPWYPNTRLFRQSVAGQWQQPFARMEAQLRAMAAQQSEPRQ